MKKVLFGLGILGFACLIFSINRTVVIANGKNLPLKMPLGLTAGMSVEATKKILKANGVSDIKKYSQNDNSFHGRANMEFGEMHVKHISASFYKDQLMSISFSAAKTISPDKQVLNILSAISLIEETYDVPQRADRSHLTLDGLVQTYSANGVDLEVRSDVWQFRNPGFTARIEYTDQAIYQAYYNR